METETKRTTQSNWVNYKLIALNDVKKFNQHQENFNTIYMKTNIEGLHVLHVLFMSL